MTPLQKVHDTLPASAPICRTMPGQSAISTRLCVRVPNDLLAEAHAIAESRGVSLSHVVVDALRREMQIVCTTPAGEEMETPG